MKQSCIFFKISNSGKLFVFVFCILILQAYSFQVSAQSVGDYRSVASGNWTSPSNWQYFNGTSWVAATTYPGGPGNLTTTYSVSILNGINITLNLSHVNGTTPAILFSVLTVNNSTLTIANNGNVDLPASALFITNNGKLEYVNQGNLYMPNQSSLTLNTGGTLVTDNNCTASQLLYIGGNKYANCNGNGGADYDFQTINEFGGSVAAIIMANTPVCSGSDIILNIGYSGPVGTIQSGGSITGVTYKLNEFINNTLVYTLDGTLTSYSLQPITLIGRSAGTYTYTMQVSTFKGTELLSSTTTNKVDVSSDPGYTTWVGSTSNDWNTNSNWCGGIPTDSRDVVIPNTTRKPIISPTTQASCNNIEIQSGATLTIQSDESKSGSLIVNGTSTGNITYNRYLENNRWYMLSSPLYNASAQNSLSNENCSIGIFNEAINGVQLRSDLPVVFEKGVGYFVKLSTGNIASFTGSLNNSMINVPVQCSYVNYGWNAVGNPFTSAIKITEAANGFIDVNKDILRPGFQAIYIWSGPAGGYKTICKANYTPEYLGVGSFTDQVVQAGQAFLVNIKDDSYPNGPVYRNISFAKTMQVHNTETGLKKASASWPGITLLASTNGKTREAMVAFNSDMTTGLDDAYDAGLLRSSDFNVYTRLVSGENENAFAMQCLPDDMYESLEVELGVDVKSAGKVTLKAVGVILPEGLYPVIEDRLLHIFTPLKSETDSLTIDMSESLEVSGRFYLHFSRELQTLDSGKPDKTNKLSARFVENRIEILGTPEPGSRARLFDMSGRIISGEYFLSPGTQNKIPAVGMPNGIYLLTIVGKSQKQTIKISLINN